MGTVVRTDPSGLTHTTRPGSYALFPKLCEPTAPVVVRATAYTDEPSRGLRMPRRTRTRAQDRAARIEAERRLTKPSRNRIK